MRERGVIKKYAQVSQCSGIFIAVHAIFLRNKDNLVAKYSVLNKLFGLENTVLCCAVLCCADFSLV
jgi:hypothetical protein